MRGNPGQRSRVPRVALAYAVIAAAAGAVTAGCGYSPPPTAPAVRHVSCGSAVTLFLTGDTQVLIADRGALTCFLIAARQCRPARLAITEMGVDVGTHYVFTIAPGGASCQVIEHSRYYSANFGGSQGPVRTTTCQRTAVTPKGVGLRCDRRDVLIPAKVSAPSPHPTSRKLS